MNEINKTLYIPLYSKAFVSRKNLFIHDEMAEQIWDTEGFTLKGKAKSKYLAYYLGVRAAVFDSWVIKKINEMPDAAVLHIGCGLDSRIKRVGDQKAKWYDLDFPEVIEERRHYYSDSESYTMLSGDATECKYIDKIDADSLIVVMEGVSMYISEQNLKKLLSVFEGRFSSIALLMDCYSSFAAKMSKYKNPINEVGVSQVYGIDDPEQLSVGSLNFISENEMTPKEYINQLKGIEKKLFEKLYAGAFSRKLYKIFEYKK